MVLTLRIMMVDWVIRVIRAISVMKIKTTFFLTDLTHCRDDFVILTTKISNNSTTFASTHVNSLYQVQLATIRHGEDVTDRRGLQL